jgi:lysyl-tRNA synthetase class 2
METQSYKDLRTKQLELTEKYPHKWEVSLSLTDYAQKYDYIKNDEIVREEVRIAGRVMNKRNASKKLWFYDLQADNTKLQILSKLDIYEKKEDFINIHGIIHRGDIIGIRGYPSRSKSGELSIIPLELKLLTPCFEMLPTEQSGLENLETRYRQRYLDMIINPKVKEIFITRSKIINYIRNFLDTRDFIEVETPIINSIASGAAARPFKTHHNDFNMDMHMRIAPELYLKTLVIGGMDRVYEIGKQFRNESLDLTHSPEFTSCEFYWAYKDYNDLMTITEEMISGLVQKIFGKLQITHGITVINFTPPYKKIDMITELEKYIGKIPTPYSSNETNEYLMKFVSQIGCPPPFTTARILDRLVGYFIEPQLIDPTFIINHPIVLSPLAKWHRDNPELTERFELFVMGKELCNAYTELNDPKVQRDRFRSQSMDRDKGDDEAQLVDDDFCKALDYGLPPTAGWGCGIDRFVMMLTNNTSIKEVLLFPAMRPI